MRALFGFLLISLATVAFSCTSFGVITNTGTLIGKNRDFLYSDQTFERISPIKQFDNWVGNPYQHRNAFYALIALNDVKFGINQFGLTAIEEDPIFPKQAHLHRRYMQPYQGYAEGMILYGILQNFATVDEIMPYLNPIFSTAAPNFYQIADKHKILTVEVAFGKTNRDTKRQFTYHLLEKKGNKFMHTNTYLSPSFRSLNLIANNPDKINGSVNRLNKIKRYVDSTTDYSHAFSWYLDTSSTVTSKIDKNFCLNTSIFRSNIKSQKHVSGTNNSVYGTVSSFMVKNNNNNTQVYVRIIQSIDVLKNGDQKITYKEMIMPLDKLFKAKQLTFTQHQLLRKAPHQGICH